ncbi:helix-turn-helix domain-containing protein [Rhodococcus jostii]|uniref:helix-turn-helix domain-containing protein n=2 Tax=Rhodococcus jostii TaxID=132919 RepID=UPI00364D0035
MSKGRIAVAHGIECAQSAAGPHCWCQVTPAARVKCDGEDGVCGGGCDRASRGSPQRPDRRDRHRGQVSDQSGGHSGAYQGVDVMSHVKHLVVVPVDSRTIADLRNLAGMTQKHVAERTGLSTTTIGRIERGEGTLSDRHSTALAEALRLEERTSREAFVRARNRPLPPR